MDDKPLFVILLGPPGSGKSTIFQSYAQSLPDEDDIQHIDVESYISRYTDYTAQKARVPRSEHNQLFLGYIRKHQADFHKYIRQKMAAGKNIALDIAGNDGVDSLLQNNYMPFIIEHNYRVHILVPLVLSTEHLYKRILRRFDTTGQTAAPFQTVQYIHKRFQKNLKNFQETLGPYLERIVIIDNDERNITFKTILLDVKPQEAECTIMGLQMKPCSFDDIADNTDDIEYENTDIESDSKPEPSLLYIFALLGLLIAMTATISYVYTKRLTRLY